MEDILMVVFVIVIGTLTLLSFFYPDAIWEWQKFLNDLRGIQSKPKPKSLKSNQRINGVLGLIFLAVMLVLYFSKR